MGYDTRRYWNNKEKRAEKIMVGFKEAKDRLPQEAVQIYGCRSHRILDCGYGQRDGFCVHKRRTYAGYNI